MTKYILHNYRRCPFCIRVRILLHLKGISYEVVEEPLRKWTQWMQEWSARSGERPRVPVLRRTDSSDADMILPESNDINLMLDATHGEMEYAPEIDSPEYQEMLTWFAWSDDVFKYQIDRFKYGENLRFDTAAHGENTKMLRDMVLKLEKVLAERKNLLGDSLTLVDIAIIPFIRQIMRTREGEFDFADFPKTEAWTKSIIETDWFTDEVMKKHALAPIGV